MTKDRGLDYAQSYAVLREFLLFEGFDPDRDLAPMKEKPTSADMRGVCEALNDLLPLMSNWPNDRVRALAAKLQTELTIDLAQLFQANRTKARRILKRGRVQSDAEFYLLRAWIDHPTGTEAEFELAWKILGAYEFGG